MRDPTSTTRWSSWDTCGDLMSNPALTAAAPLARHLELRAGGYFEDLAGRNVKVELVETRSRPASSLLRFELRPASGGGPVHGVVAKLIDERPGDPSGPAGMGSDRPRLAPITDRVAKQRFEHDTMAAIEAEVAGRADPALAAVRVLGLLPDEGALLLEAVRWPTLRDRLRLLLVRRDRAARSAMELAFHRCGRWLRMLHELDGEVEARHRSGDEVVAVTAALEEHLRRSGLTEPVLARVRRLTDDRPASCYPPAYPLARAHGDFAPRNLFVADGGRIAGFDVVGRWQTPPALDLAYFAAALRFSRLQLRTGGRAVPEGTFRRAETALLDGYDETVPDAPLRAFVLLVLLDRWAALRSRAAVSARSADLTAIDRVGVRAITEALTRLEGET
jgi:hypothetical protein